MIKQVAMALAVLAFLALGTIVIVCGLIYLTSCGYPTQAGYEPRSSEVSGRRLCDGR